MLRTGIQVKGKATFRRKQEEASEKERQLREKDGATSYLETCQMKRWGRRERWILISVVCKVEELVYVEPEAREGAEHTDDRK